MAAPKKYVIFNFMNLQTVYFTRQVLRSILKTSTCTRLCSTKAKEPEYVDYDTKKGFRTLNIIPGPVKVRDEDRERIESNLHTTPRFKLMSVDQDWTDTWPTAQTVNWNTLPFPVRQGYVKNRFEGDGGVPPRAGANLELMKIPNFLHLTPAHIIKHCAALKKFCTPWPNHFDTATSSKKNGNFPLEVSTFDYCFSGPSIRDPRARVVVVEFPLDKLNLNKHGREKFMRLVGKRYSEKTGKVKLIVDRCPTKKQNFDYAMYLLTVLYHESMKVEKWEKQIEETDMLQYKWDLNKSKQNVIEFVQLAKKTQKSSNGPSLAYLPSNADGKVLSVVKLKPVQNHKKSVETLMNTSENKKSLNDYKHTVLSLLGLQDKQ